MRTLVDRTTVALGVEVCSFYLLDRDGAHLTLAATNGLDAGQVGQVSLAVGEGITGTRGRRAAQPGRLTRDVTTDEPLPWVRGLRHRTGSARCSRCRSSGTSRWSACSTSRRPRSATSRADEVEFLGTIAALLAGIVEKGRLQAEAEAQLDRLSQLDAARAELLAVVTHELRTPLAVVRAYVDLLADAAGGERGRAVPGRPWSRTGGQARPTR